MTDNLFFDTDCISSFLWVNQENIFLQLYKGKIVLPEEVFAELSKPSIPHLKSKVESLIKDGKITTMEIMINTEEYNLFYNMSYRKEVDGKQIGKGEAAALALAKVHNGILASNNLKDISSYVSYYNIKHLTTGDILVEALNKGLIEENDGNVIWSRMIEKRRKLPTNTFTDYLNTFTKRCKLL